MAMNEPLESILAIAERSFRATDLAERNLWLVEPSWSVGTAQAEMSARNIDVAPIREKPVRRYVAQSELRDRPANEPAISAAHPVDITHLVTGDMGLAEALE